VQTPSASSAVAEQHFRRALELEPGHCEAAAALVTVLQQRQDLPGAAAVIKDQIARQPTDALHLQLGHIHRRGAPTVMLLVDVAVCHTRDVCRGAVTQHATWRSLPDLL
jgi:hypothetical protein